jgi:hypothetical protein
MKTKTFLQFKTIILLISLNLPYVLYAQQTDTTLWSLSDCINYALQQNIEVRGSELANKSNEIYFSELPVTLQEDPPLLPLLIFC